MVLWARRVFENKKNEKIMNLNFIKDPKFLRL